MKKKSLSDTAEKLLAPKPADNATPDNFGTQAESGDKHEYDEQYEDLRLRLPHGVDVRSAIDYGFYEHRNRYWMMRRNDTFEPVSNFTMRVKFLIVGAHPKRIVEIRNVFGKTATLDLDIEDLISLEKFKGRVESQGNFLFDGKPADLSRIKSRLFNEERPSIEITRLGQYKSKFYAFANGIYHEGAFQPIDDNGMVQIGEEHYYIPVFGATQADDDEDLRNYRRFVHQPSDITFAQWSELFCQVYGDNGRVGIAFGLFALFSDIVFELTKGAPMLFLFGQRGSGKGTMANSLLCMFGFPQDPIMLGGASTVVGFMRKLGQFSDAIVWLDEYKNDIGERKIESIKNIWDRIGYERGVKDSSNRTQTTPVTSSAIVSGQEIPNVEPALFSRCILLEFRAMQRTQQEVQNFDQLRRMEGQGITNVTLEALTHRDAIKALFQKYYTEIAAELRKVYAAEDVIERQINNYAILVAIVRSLEGLLPLPFTWVNLMQICELFLIRQRDMMKQSNEVQQFIEMVAFLLGAGLISDGKELHITQGLVKIRMITVIPYYRDYSRRQGLKPLDKGTLLNYIENSEAYCPDETKKSSHRFPGLQNPTSCTVFLHEDLKRLYGVDFTSITQNADNQQNAPEPDPF